jgi:hypothetical protein
MEKKIEYKSVKYNIVNTTWNMYHVVLQWQMVHLETIFH